MHRTYRSAYLLSSRDDRSLSNVSWKTLKETHNYLFTAKINHRKEKSQITAFGESLPYLPHATLFSHSSQYNFGRAWPPCAWDRTVLATHAIWVKLFFQSERRKQQSQTCWFLPQEVNFQACTCSLYPTHNRDLRLNLFSWIGIIEKQENFDQVELNFSKNCLENTLISKSEAMQKSISFWA